MADDPSPWGKPSADDVRDAPREPAPSRGGSPWLPPSPTQRIEPGAKRAQGLDDLLSHRAFGPELPKLPGGSRWWLWTALAAAGLWLTTGLHVLQPAEAGIVTRFGQYQGTLAPGVHVTAPVPIDRIAVVPVREEQSLSLGGQGGPLLTADGALANVNYALRWSVADPRAYVFGVAEPDALLRRVAEGAMRGAVARLGFADLGRTEVRAELARTVQSNAQAALDRAGAGVRVASVNIATVTPPGEVVAAFDAVGKARTDADAAVATARRETSAAVDRVRSDADAFNRMLVQYQAAPQATRTRLYYETMERILTPVPKAIAPAGSTVAPPPGSTATVTVPAAPAGNGATKR